MPAVDEILAAWACDQREEVFISAKALSAHRCMRGKLLETHCPVCMNEFHTRARLIAHVTRASPVCRSVVENHCEAEDPVNQADELSRKQERGFRKLGRHRTWAEFPSFRREGPFHEV